MNFVGLIFKGTQAGDNGSCYTCRTVFWDNPVNSINDTGQWPEENQYPTNPIETMADYKNGGSVYGSGCAQNGTGHNRLGDTGGIADLLVTSPDSCAKFGGSSGFANNYGGVYCREFAHNYNGNSGSPVDMGQTMYCLNTTGTDFSLTSTAQIQGTTIGSYGHIITTGGAESSQIACPNCNGSLLTSTVASFPVTIAAHSGMEFTQ